MNSFSAFGTCVSYQRLLRFVATQQQDCTAFGVKGMEYPVWFAAMLYAKFAQFCRTGDIPAMPCRL